MVEGTRTARPAKRRVAATPTNSAALLEDLVDRFEMIETTVKAIAGTQESLVHTVHGLRDRDGEMDQTLRRTVDEQKRQADALVAALDSQGKLLRESLIAEADARKLQGEEFKAALKLQGEEFAKGMTKMGTDALETLKLAFFKSAGEKVISWIWTLIVGGGAVSAALHYGKLSW